MYINTEPGQQGQSNHSTQLITQLTATHSYTKATQCQETDLVPSSTSNSLLQSLLWDCTQCERTPRSLVLHALSSSLGTFLPATFKVINPAVHKLQLQCLPPQLLYHCPRILSSAALSHIPSKQKDETQSHTTSRAPTSSSPESHRPFPPPAHKL